MPPPEAGKRLEADQVELLPGAVEGLRGILRLGFGVVVVTNQSGVERGYFTSSDLERAAGAWR